MKKIHNSKLTPLSTTLRKNMTQEERKLWYVFLKKLPVHFSRQKIVGNYIVDFYCASAKIIIELDGSQHYDDEGMKADAERDKYLKEIGFKVLRFSNREINLNFDNVCNEIEYCVNGEK